MHQIITLSSISKIALIALIVLLIVTIAISLKRECKHVKTNTYSKLDHVIQEYTYEVEFCKKCKTILKITDFGYDVNIPFTVGSKMY